MTTVIDLPRGLQTLVDDEDVPRLQGLPMYVRLHHRSREPYAYTKVPPTGREVSLTRLLTGHALVDHANHDTLDNRRSNLRIATPSQNSANARPWSGRKLSPFKGVTARRDRGTWSARITVNRKVRTIGYFKTEIEAALAYDEAARGAFGEFAYLNFPETPR